MAKDNKPFCCLSILTRCNLVEQHLVEKGWQMIIFRDFFYIFWISINGITFDRNFVVVLQNILCFQCAGHILENIQQPFRFAAQEAIILDVGFSYSSLQRLRGIASFSWLALSFWHLWKFHFSKVNGKHFNYV